MTNGDLSAAQEAILVDQLLKPDASNSTATIWRIRGSIEIDRLLDAIRETVADTAALHVAFVSDDSTQLRAVPTPSIDWAPQFFDARLDSDSDAAAEAFLLDLCSRPFELARGALFRIAVVQLADAEHLMGLVLHHVLTDAYGVFEILSQGIAKAYRGAREESHAGQADNPVAVGARDTAYRQSPLFQEDANFWQDYLGRAAPAARLPRHGSAPEVTGGRWDTLGAALGVSSCTTVIPRALIDDLLTAPVAVGSVSFPDLVMASVVGFFSRVCAAQRFTFCFTVNFRHGAYRKAAGLYSNSVPSSVEVPLNETTLSLARRLASERLEVLQHAEYNVALMKRVSSRAGSIRSPFGPVVNVMPFLTALDLDTAIGTLDGGVFGAPDEAMVSVFTDGSVTSDLFVRIDAPTALYSTPEVRALSGALTRYLSAALRRPDAPIGTLGALTTAVPALFGSRVIDDISPVDLQDVLADNAVRRAREAAVVDGHATLSHSDLADQVLDMRRLLLAAGVQPGQVVALTVPACLRLVALQIALVLSGAVTAPLAPGAPLSDLSTGNEQAPSWLVSLAGLDEIVVTPLVNAVPAWPASVTSTDLPSLDLPPHSPATPSAPCYAAAGSTLSRAGLHALLRQVAEAAQIGPDDSVLIRHAGWQPLCAVLAGATVVVNKRPEDARAATVAFLSAGELETWSASGPRLRAVVHSRTPLPAATLRAWSDAGCGTLTMGWSPDPSLPPLTLTTAGTATPMQVLAGAVTVLDANGWPVPPGFIGSLHAAIPRAWAAPPPELDLLASAGPDGLRVWGPADRTVNTPNGVLYLPEVERIAETSTGVAEAAARILPSEDPIAVPRLVLYVAPQDGGLLGGAANNVSFKAGLDPAHVREVVAAHVAGLATVADVVVVGCIPHTVDNIPRTEDLPLVAHADMSRAPDTAQEIQIADLFQQVLGRPDIAASGDFFQLGGDSITAMRLSSLARRAGVSLSVRDVFEHRTVENLAASVTTAEPNSTKLSGPPTTPRDYPLPPVAAVFDRGEAFDRFAQWLAVVTPPALSSENLASMLQQLIDRHDALRSHRVAASMAVSAPGALAADQVLDVVSLPTPPAELSVPDLSGYAATAVAHIDARDGDLARFVFLDGPHGTTGLLICAFHHLVIDGVSWQVILDDLAELHNAVIVGAERDPATAPVTFAEWCIHINNTAASGHPHAWDAVFDGVPDDDKTLIPDVDVVASSEAVHLALDPSLSGALGTWVARRLNCSIEDLLVAAFVVALPDSDSGPVVVRMEGHGRASALSDGREPTHTLGWFTSVYPLRVDLSDLSSSHLDPGWLAARAVHRVREAQDNRPQNLFAYAAEAYAPGRAVTARRADRFGFNYLGRFSGHASGVPWTPAVQTPVIVPAPDSRMPLASVLNLDVASIGDADTEILDATFTFATRHLRRDIVQDIAERWRQTLASLRTLAADAPQPLTTGLAPHVTGREWATLSQQYGRIEEIWPLTPLQQGLYYHWLRSNSPADGYQLQFCFTLEGRVDVDRLGTAVEMTVRRLPNLRVVFVGSDSGDPLQIVLPASDTFVPFSVVDLCPDEALAAGNLSNLLAEERRSTFDLRTAPPLRFTLYLIDEVRCCLSLNAHHILLDGWSLPLLLTEILQAYAQGEAYDDHPDTRFQSILLQTTAARTASIIAWTAELQGLNAPFLLPSTTGGQDPDRADLGEIAVPLLREHAARIAASAAALGVTTNVLLQSAWAVTVSLATGTDDVCFGNTVAVRPPQVDGSDECIGMLTNTVPVRVRAKLDHTLADIARQVQETTLRMLDHWGVGLGDIVAATNQPELFDSIIVFESFPIDHAALRQASDAADLDVTEITPYAPTHYPFTLIAAADPVLSATIQFRGGHTCRRRAEQLATDLATVLGTYVDASLTRVAQVERVTQLDRERLLTNWNETAGDYTHATVEAQFAHRAQQSPDRIAVVHDGQPWTYGELADEATRVCGWLTHSGVRRGDKVAVAVPRSPSCLAVILGIWQAGAVYVPVDPGLPPSRAGMILEDSAPNIVITNDIVNARPWANVPANHPALPVTTADAAYAFFTSGSTGRPQGVLVSHDALANFLDAMQRVVEVTERDRWLSVTTTSFDISLLELFQPLLRGATIVIANDDDRPDPERLWQLASEAGVTIMQATPSLWRGVCTEAMPDLRGFRVLVGGEALDGELAGQLVGRSAAAINVYGPTETTIWSTCALLHDSPPPSIGRPILNTQVYVLDFALRPLPVGEIGELWIAGTGLAMGYFNSPRLTAARFIANPFADRPGQRMYRTGDLVRWTEQGEIEFLGRNDTQVKLRGMRIEISDVERLLLRHPDIRQVQVTLQERSGEPARLIAYLVLEDPTLQRPRDFEAFLERDVPEHMQPALTVILNAFPLTPNGKIDRKRLPEPQPGSDTYVPPSSELESRLCQLFAEALGLERVGIRDEFVASGGHSLIATRLVSRIRTELGVEVPIQELFTARTVRGLSARWNQFGATKRRAITRNTTS